MPFNTILKVANVFKQCCSNTGGAQSQRQQTSPLCLVVEAASKLRTSINAAEQGDMFLSLAAALVRYLKKS